mmetsp:Transcript_7850/g.9892  ORF Transcript_7850/g.9892 Transcript_7850/m.9892 type:complete len:970 (+) Transcript_7850:106-3015(+)
MSGSFWKFSNGLSSLSNISTLLENHSNDQASNNSSNSKTYDLLMKLLEENDLLQELLSNNSMLLEFLREEEVLSFLVDLVIEEGNIDDSLSTDVSKLNLDSEKSDSVIEKADEKDISDKSKKNDKKDNSGKKAHNVANIEDEKHIEEEHKEESDDDDNDEGDNDDNGGNEEDDDDDEEDAETDNETAEDRAVRHATLAAEILSADVWSLTDTVMESTENLNKLWSVLDSKKPLSINLSTYFMKIMEHLLDMKCDEMITYLIDNQPNLVKKFINHLSNPPLMDFLLKLISTDKPDNSTGIIDFLQNQDFITHLINSLDITGDDNASENYDILLVKQSSAADFLKALITISANSTTDNSTIGPNELTRELVSYDQMDRLCKIMLKGGYALANGVGIIIEIIRKNNSDYDILPVLYITLESHPPTGRDPIYLGHLLKIFGNKIEDFNNLLMDQNNSTNSILKTPFGEIKPLGFERFKICELIAELLHCSNMALLNDNKGFDVVKERDILRNKMKEFDPVSFKYNEVIVLPNDEGSNDNKANSENDNEGKNSRHIEDDDFANDTIDSFNSKLNHENDTMIQYQNPDQDDEEEPHANANLSEEQIRANPVIGDFLKISLYDTQIISNILSMFLQFPWNNFLHNVVFDIVQQVLNGSMDIGFNKFLAIDLFHYGDITNKIIEGQKLCTDFEDNHNGLRLGFMGHLTLIAEEVVKFIQLYPTHTLSELIDTKVEDEIWEEYVSHVLYDTREKYNAILGGGEEDEEDDDASNTFDEGTGEIIEQNDFKPGLLLDPKTDHDIIGSGFEEGSKDDGHYEENKYHESADTIKSNSSDESSEDDDDHFTNYMSQQLTNTASTEILSSVKSPSDEESSEKNDSFKRIPGNINIHSENDEMDTDEYIDPNDDGLSYKKSHPLYDATGSLLSASSREDDEISSEDSSSSSSDSDDEIILDDDNESKTNEKGSNGNKLSRSASRS